MYKEKENGIELHIKVLPKSSLNAIVGKENESLKIKITAPPDKGLANKAVIELCSSYFDVAKSKISLISGDTSRQKKLFFHLSKEERGSFLKKLSSFQT